MSCLPSNPETHYTTNQSPVHYQTRHEHHTLHTVALLDGRASTTLGGLRRIHTMASMAPCLWMVESSAR